MNAPWKQLSSALLTLENSKNSKISAFKDGPSKTVIYSTEHILYYGPKNFTNKN